MTDISSGIRMPFCCKRLIKPNAIVSLKQNTAVGRLSIAMILSAAKTAVSHSKLPSKIQSSLTVNLASAIARRKP
ncbi:Uncharacterised protein [Vibrio cholerae]|nr:Uncharacterised protein [Vibrio cholerae]